MLLQPIDRIPIETDPISQRYAELRREVIINGLETVTLMGLQACGAHEGSLPALGFAVQAQVHEGSVVLGAVGDGIQDGVLGA